MDPLTDRDPAACPPLTPLSARIAWAAAFERRIVAREHDLVAAVRTDIHKADWETVTQDILPLVASIAGTATTPPASSARASWAARHGGCSGSATGRSACRWGACS